MMDAGAYQVSINVLATIYAPQIQKKCEPVAQANLDLGTRNIASLAK